MEELNQPQQENDELTESIPEATQISIHDTQKIKNPEDTPEQPQPPVNTETVSPTQNIETTLDTQNPPFADTREVATNPKNNFEVAKEGPTANQQLITVEQRLTEATDENERSRALTLWRKLTGILGGKKPKP